MRVQEYGSKRIHENQGAACYLQALIGISEDALRPTQGLYLVEIPPNVRKRNGLPPQGGRPFRFPEAEASGL